MVGLKPTNKMNLTSNFYEAARRIEVLADIVLGHGFDLCVGQAFAAKIGQGMLNEPPA